MSIQSRSTTDRVEQGIEIKDRTLEMVTWCSRELSVATSRVGLFERPLYSPDETTGIGWYKFADGWREFDGKVDWTGEERKDLNRSLLLLPIEGGLCWKKWGVGEVLEGDGEGVAVGGVRWRCSEDELDLTGVDFCNEKWNYENSLTSPRRLH